MGIGKVPVELDSPFVILVGLLYQLAPVVYVPQKAVAFGVIRLQLKRVLYVLYRGLLFLFLIEYSGPVIPGTGRLLVGDYQAVHEFLRVIELFFVYVKIYKFNFYTFPHDRFSRCF